MRCDIRRAAGDRTTLHRGQFPLVGPGVIEIESSRDSVRDFPQRPLIQHDAMPSRVVGHCWPAKTARNIPGGFRIRPGTSSGIVDPGLVGIGSRPIHSPKKNSLMMIRVVHDAVGKARSCRVPARRDLDPVGIDAAGWAADLVASLLRIGMEAEEPSVGDGASEILPSVPNHHVIVRIVSHRGIGSAGDWRLGQKPLPNPDVSFWTEFVFHETEVPRVSFLVALEDSPRLKQLVSPGIICRCEERMAIRDVVVDRDQLTLNSALRSRRASVYQGAGSVAGGGRPPDTAANFSELVFGTACRSVADFLVIDDQDPAVVRIGMKGCALAFFQSDHRVGRSNRGLQEPFAVICYGALYGSAGAFLDPGITGGNVAHHAIGPPGIGKRPNTVRTEDEKPVGVRDIGQLVPGGGSKRWGLPTGQAARDGKRVAPPGSAGLALGLSEMKQAEKESCCKHDCPCRRGPAMATYCQAHF